MAVGCLRKESSYVKICTSWFLTQKLRKENRNNWVSLERNTRKAYQIIGDIIGHVVTRSDRWFFFRVIYYGFLPNKHYTNTNNSASENDLYKV